MAEDTRTSGRPRQPEPSGPSLPQSRRAADRAEAARRAHQGPYWAPFFILAVVLPMGLAQAWLAHAPHAIAYDLDRLEEESRRVRDDLEAAHVACESFRAPQAIAAMAEEMGYERPPLPPVVIELSKQSNGRDAPRSAGAFRFSLAPLLGRALEHLLPGDPEERPRQLSAAAQGLAR